MKLVATTPVKDQVFRAVLPPHSVMTFVVSGVGLQRLGSEMEGWKRLTTLSASFETGGWPNSSVQVLRFSDRANDVYSVVFEVHMRGSLERWRLQNRSRDFL